jgi:hypothetical protein
MSMSNLGPYHNGAVFSAGIADPFVAAFLPAEPTLNAIIELRSGCLSVTPSRLRSEIQSRPRPL